jgi:hypothetical protein
MHLREARRHARLAEATAAAGSRRSGGSTRRRGKVAPASYSWRLKAPTRTQETPRSSSPPGTSPGQLLGDEAASAARSGCGGNLGFRRLAKEARAAARARVGAPGGAAALNSPGDPALACGPRGGESGATVVVGWLGPQGHWAASRVKSGPRLRRLLGWKAGGLSWKGVGVRV